MAKILLVQKDAKARRELQQILQSQHHEVISHGSTTRGIKTLEHDPAIQLVICDLATSDRSGLGLLQRLQTTPRLHWLPVLMTSRSFDSEAVKQCLELGAADLIILPAEEGAIATKVDKALADGRRKVLIVEDEGPVLDVLSDIFEIERFDVVRAMSAEESVELLAASHVHVIVLDIMLPKKSGFELLKELKQDHEQLPVIVVTAYSGKYQRQDVLEAGADAYFTKPFKNTELVRTVRRLLRTTSPWQSRRQHLLLQK